MTDLVLFHSMEDVGAAANQMASENVFADFQSRKAKNSLVRQRNDLAVFQTYLLSVGVEAENLFSNPSAWHGITWGIVKGFVSYMVLQGYALSSVNHRLTTVRSYATLANQARAVSSDELLRIKSVKGYAAKEALKVNEKRIAENIPVRMGFKKAEATSISESQLDNILAMLPDTPQGHRDMLLMLILSELGLRVGELQALETSNFNLEDGTITFYRQKVNITQTHRLSMRLWEAAKLYINQDADGVLWRGSMRSKVDGSRLTDSKMSIRAISKRIAFFGQKVGVKELSPHDLRHHWTTRAARKTSLDNLMQAGGWASYAMPLHYIERHKIANEGVVLS